MKPHERQDDIVSKVQDRQRMTISELLPFYKVCRRTLRRDVNVLVDEGVLLSDKKKGGYITINPDYKPFGDRVTFRDLDNTRRVIDEILKDEPELRDSVRRVYHRALKK